MSVVPAIVSVVPVPVTVTAPGANVAVSCPPKLTPGSVVVTVPLNEPRDRGADFRFAAPLVTVTRPPPSFSDALVTSSSMSAPSRVKVMSPLSFWPATSSVPPVTARRTKPVAVFELGADGAGERDARDGQREAAGERARDLAGAERQRAGAVREARDAAEATA